MADDQNPGVGQDPQAVEARAHMLVEAARSDALARAKHKRDLDMLQAALAARAAPVPTPAPESAAPAVEPPPEPAAPVEAVAEPLHETQSEAPLASSPSPADPAPKAPRDEPAPAPESEPPPPEPRSRRAPFPSGRTKPGPRTFDAASSAVVSRPLHEWLRVHGELTDAEAADGEAGGARLQALVAAHGADATWSTTRPA